MRVAIQLANCTARENWIAGGNSAGKLLLYGRTWLLLSDSANVVFDKARIFTEVGNQLIGNGSGVAGDVIDGVVVVNQPAEISGRNSLRRQRADVADNVIHGHAAENRAETGFAIGIENNFAAAGKRPGQGPSP